MLRKQSIKGLLYLFLALRVIIVASYAEQLPVKTYTTGDGLPRDDVTLVRQDSRGFIWMVAGDGLSRFDGYKFTNYTTDDGLADRRVNDLLETRSGVYWVATSRGLCRFNPTGRRLENSDYIVKSQSVTTSDLSPSTRNHDEPMFTVFNPHPGTPTVFNTLVEDKTGAIWCGTDDGLYKLLVSPDGGAQ
ncbi:MAG: hypothetical protein ABR563_05210, partial [Pyrinomonadaceae bacterium]